MRWTLSIKLSIPGRVLPGLIIAVVTLGASAFPAAAQSGYHWSDQFGNRSTLLNGTMIAGVSDMGAVFYNPGRLAQLDRPGFLLTAEAFELSRVELKGGTGDNLELNQTSLRGVPSLVAGLFTLPDLPGHKFAYSFLTRRRGDSDLLLTTENQVDLVSHLPGPETYLGTWESLSKVDETWVGLSWAYEVSSRVSVGVTTFGTYVGRKRRIELDVRVVPDSSDPSALVRSREYSFDSFGLLWKAGLAVDLTPFRLGLSLTTPQLNPFGSGSIRYEELFSAPEVSGIVPRPDTEVTVFREDGLALRTRTPFALGGGVTWEGRRGTVHLSGEWYSAVSQYEIMGVDSVLSQTSEEVKEYRVKDELSSVFNYGIGVEWKLRGNLSAYGSVARDASAAPEDTYEPFGFGDKISNTYLQADGVHIGSGITIEATWIDFTFGFSYGTTSQVVQNPLTGSNPVPEVPYQAAQLELQERRWRFLIGFTVPFVEGV